MKRFVLGVLMLGSFALAAAPAHANFNLNLECGKSYAVEMHGTEPALTADQPLNYIAGVGVLTFGPQTPVGLGNGCTVTSGELIYNDSDIVGLSAGPATCYTASSLLGGGIPCFDGGDWVTGSLMAGPDGGAILSLLVTFNWVDGAPAPGVMFPVSFTLQGNAGNLTVLGNSVPDPGPTPAGAPLSPVLVLTMQQQTASVNATLPVTGPGPAIAALPAGYLVTPLGTTGGGGNGYGVAPYVGLQNSLFQGYSAPSGDFLSQPIQGTFGTTVSSLQIFPNGQAGGSVSFNSNDNVGNTTGATNDDCDTQVIQTGNFADGTSNNAAALVHPSATCVDAIGVATFELSSVVWGPIDYNNFSIVTGLSAAAITSGKVIPAGLMSDSTGLFGAPAGNVVNLVFQTIVSVNGNAATYPYVGFFSTTPAGCDVSISMPTMTSGTGPTFCSLSLDDLTHTPTNPVNAVVEGDTFPFSKYAYPICQCNGTSGGSVMSTVTLTSSDCPLFGTTSYAVTCKN